MVKEAEDLVKDAKVKGLELTKNAQENLVAGADFVEKKAAQGWEVTKDVAADAKAKTQELARDVNAKAHDSALYVEKKAAQGWEATKDVAADVQVIAHDSALYVEKNANKSQSTSQDIAFDAKYNLKQTDDIVHKKTQLAHQDGCEYVSVRDVYAHQAVVQDQQLTKDNLKEAAHDVKAGLNAHEPTLIEKTQELVQAAYEKVAEVTKEAIDFVTGNDHPQKR